VKAKQNTPGDTQRQSTYKAKRQQPEGHAPLSWSIHSLFFFLSSSVAMIAGTAISLDTAGDVADEFVVGGRILTNLSNWIAAQ
jgi:hypothetical protein